MRWQIALAQSETGDRLYSAGAKLFIAWGWMMQQTEGWWRSLLPAPAPLPLNDGVIASAVLVPFLSKAGDDHIILTKRASHLSKHAGQISFPGGRIDASDASERAAALREAEEEIALPPTLVEVKGYLPDLYTGTGYQSPQWWGALPRHMMRLPRYCNLPPQRWMRCCLCQRLICSPLRITHPLCVNMRDGVGQAGALLLGRM